MNVSLETKLRFGFLVQILQILGSDAIWVKYRAVSLRLEL